MLCGPPCFFGILSCLYYSSECHNRGCVSTLVIHQSVQFARASSFVSGCVLIILLSLSFFFLLGSGV
jgi:hypothetical protein